MLNADSGNRYDKIAWENIDLFLPILISRVLHIDVVESEDLPGDLQYTLEQKPDVLRRIVNRAGQ